MDKFFLQHNVLQDRDQDELTGRVSSDSDVSDDNDKEITNHVHSVADPSGPWKQKAVNGETWGKPMQGFRHDKGRDYASVYAGPKGVINDYKVHKRYQKEERLKKETERQVVLHRITKGVVVPILPSTQDVTARVRDESDSDSDWECDQADIRDDDAFLAQYHERRMKQMQQVARNRKLYGDIEYITPEQFVTLTSTTSDDGCRKMLVHLYHPDNYACKLLNMQFELLAQKLVHVKFAAMIAKEADASIEMADLPVLLIFDSHQHQEAIVDVARRLDGEFTYDRVEAFVTEQLEL